MKRESTHIVTCPHSRRGYRASDSELGRKIDCPHRGCAFRLKEASPADALRILADAYRNSGRTSKSRGTAKGKRTPTTAPKKRDEHKKQ